MVRSIHLSIQLFSRLSCSPFLMGWRCKRSWTLPSILKLRITCLRRCCMGCSEALGGRALCDEDRLLEPSRGCFSLGTSARGCLITRTALNSFCFLFSFVCHVAC